MVVLAQSDAMNFLNEISTIHPHAISLAAGRPAEKFFDRLHPQALLEAMNYFTDREAERNQAFDCSRVLQYGRTAGIINELIAQQLHNDHGIPACAEQLLITSGCQEALALCIPVLCREPEDVLLIFNPTYTGATGVAQSNRILFRALRDGDPAQAIEHAVMLLRQEGLRARALYVIPDFDNPTGRVLDESQRRSILNACARHHIVILEDNPYGLFRYEGHPVPSMSALDNVGCVIFLNTFSKTLCPALRVGCAALPDTLFGDRTAQQTLWHTLVQRKSYVTVNTSSINQAIVGGFLLAHDCSLHQWTQPMVAWYRTNRDTMLSALQQVFRTFPGEVLWNRPAGGFFLTLELPFEFDAKAVATCATEFGVVVMPMAFFAFDASQNRHVRLAFSAVTPEEIRTGIQALGGYVTQRLDS